MFIPKPFHETDLEKLDWLAARDAFGTLTSLVDGVPFATHLPVLYQRDGNEVRLTGHWAKLNPQWISIDQQRVLFIFHGPHTYISPRWYAQPKSNVPTWNYATAHIYGRVEVTHDHHKLRRIVSSLSDRYEAGAQTPWRFEDATAAQNEIRGIVGFELIADEIQLKFKLSQHHPAEKIEGVAAALSKEGRPDGVEIARLMRAKS